MAHFFLKRSIFTCVVCSLTGMTLLFPQATAIAQDKQYSEASRRPSSLDQSLPSIVDQLKQIRDGFDFQDKDYVLTRDLSVIWLYPKKPLSLTDLHYNLQYIPASTFVMISLAQNSPYEQKIFGETLTQFNVATRIHKEGTHIFQIDPSKTHVTPFLDDLHKRGISSNIRIVALGCEIGPLNSTLRSRNLVKIIETHMKRSSQKNSPPFMLRTSKRSGGQSLYLSGRDDRDSVFTVDEEKGYLNEK